MNIVFYSAGFVAVAATLMVITRLNAVHALLYLVVSLLAVALVFLSLGAPFAAALEVVTYAGAIMVLFVFVMMLLNVGSQSVMQERQWLQPGIWRGPALLAATLAVELAYLFIQQNEWVLTPSGISPQQVGLALFGPYLLGVEIASMLLLAGLVVAYHIGRKEENKPGAKFKGGN